MNGANISGKNGMTCYMPVSSSGPKETKGIKPPITCYMYAANDSFTGGGETASIGTPKPGQKPTTTCYMSPDLGGGDLTMNSDSTGLTSQQKMNRLQLMQDRGSLQG